MLLGLEFLAHIALTEEVLVPELQANGPLGVPLLQEAPVPKSSRPRLPNNDTPKQSELIPRLGTMPSAQCHARRTNQHRIDTGRKSCQAEDISAPSGTHPDNADSPK